MFDCKTLESKNGLFPLNRVEQNQRMAYKRFRETGNEYYFLAILWNNNVYLINLEYIDFKNKHIDLKNEEPFKENFYES